VSTQEFGSVPALLGDSGHSGLQPGPAPQENPALAWRFDSGSEILASPIIADGIVYVTNRAGFLYAIDAATGEQLWRVEVGPYVLRTTPTWHDGALYLVAGFDAISLDAATGEERWRETIRYAGTASPTVSDDAMFVVSQEGLLYALDITDGAELWRISTDGISFGSPAASSGRLVVATDRGIVVGLNPETGRASWRRDFDVPIYTTAAITGDTVWIVTTDGVIRGLDLDNGGDQTNVTTNSDLSVTADGGVVFAPSDDGGIYAIEGESGNVDWFASTGGEVRSGPNRYAGHRHRRQQNRRLRHRNRRADLVLPRG
jgi:outer membrane protein assembly factor BamB